MIWFIRKLHFLLIIMFLAFILNCSHDDSFKIKLVLPLLNSNSSNTATTSGSLTNLVPSTGTLSPSFSSTVFNYTMSVGNSVSSIQFTPTSSDTTARITIYGATVSSGASSNALALTLGTNTITVLFTPVNGTATQYTITITRSSTLSSISSISSLSVSLGTLSPTFSSGTTAYTMTVANGVSSITVTPTLTDSLSTMTVNGTSVNSGSASGSITINVGNNTITIVVTAENGNTTSYTITVTRLNATTKRMFVTANSYNGNLGGVTGADSLCNADTNKPNDGSTYKAVITDATNRVACSNANCTLATENVNWVIGANLNYIRASDAATLFTSNSAGIFSFGSITNSFDTSSNKYWTGLNANWTSNGSHCSLWANTGGSGMVGNGNQTNNNAISQNTQGCSGTQNLLCAEQ